MYFFYSKDVVVLQAWVSLSVLAAAAGEQTTFKLLQVSLGRVRLLFVSDSESEDSAAVVPVLG